MQREAVDSEAIASVGYDPDMRVLEIEFASRTVYRYFDVPESVHAGLMTATSLGEYFGEHIRDAGYSFERRA